MVHPNLIGHRRRDAFINTELILAEFLTPSTMPDSATPPAVTPAAPARTRGYYQQVQLDDIALAEVVLAAGRSNAADLVEQDIDASYLDSLAAAAVEARKRATETGQAKEVSEDSTETTSVSAKALYTALQKIQSSAKQKHKMLAEDGDPTTNFPTDGYLIGVRLNANRSALLQSSNTLIARIKADDLPGFKTPQKITAVEALLTAYKDDKSDQAGAIKEKELARLDRDDLLHVLNTRRSAVQHAADAIWPWSDEAHRPIRKTFGLPLTRPMGM